MLIKSQVAGLVVELHSKVSYHRIKEAIYLGYVSLSLGRESITSTFSFGDFLFVRELFE